MNLTQRSPLVFVLTLIACVTDRGNAGSVFDGGGGGGPADSTGDGNASDDGGDDGEGDGNDGEGDDGDDGGGIKYDVEDGSGGPGDQQEECGKVDFLFVVDPSSSMNNDRQNLIDNFPAFIDGILSTLTKVDDYHVGVIATRGYEGNISGSGCDQDGALVVEKPIWESPPKACGPYAEGHNYMTTADDLVATFSCAADVHADILSDYERPMSSLLTATDGTIAGPGECNEGFLRDDSLLVVVIITDEPDGPGDPEVDDYCYPGNQWGFTPDHCRSPGTPPEWFNEVVAARGGMEENIVVLSLVVNRTADCTEYPDHLDDAYDNIIEFTEMFTHGLVACIKDPDYGPYFQEAISVIDVACEEYVPPEG